MARTLITSLAAAASLIALVAGVVLLETSVASNETDRNCGGLIEQEKQRYGSQKRTVRSDGKTRNGSTTQTARDTNAKRTRVSQRSKRSRRSRRTTRARNRTRKLAASAPKAVDSRAQPLAAPAQVKFPFGSGREPVIRHQVFQAPQGAPLAAMRVYAPFGDVSALSGEVLPYTQLAGGITRRGPGRLFTVAMCINPAGPTEMAAGTYSGAILVGTRNQVAPVALESTVQDDRWWRAVLAALLGGLAGLYFKLFADARSGGSERKLDHARGPRFLIAVGAACVAGVYSYLTIYLDDATFRANAESLWRITLEVFGGTIAAKAVTDLAGPATARGNGMTKRGRGGGEAGSKQSSDRPELPPADQPAPT